MDNPVTPDREALKLVAFDAAFPGIPQCMTGHEARRRISAAVDAVLPLLTDALDRARQQGRNEAAAAIERITWTTAIGSGKNRYGGTAFFMGVDQAARLARGGPNREDEE